MPALHQLLRFDDFPGRARKVALSPKRAFAHTPMLASAAVKAGPEFQARQSMRYHALRRIRHQQDDDDASWDAPRLLRIFWLQVRFHH